ncbi:MAG: twin-arginine translocase subunit TatC [Ktedonobacterales bacterium]
MAASDLHGGELRVDELDALGRPPLPAGGGADEEPEGATMTLVEHLEELRRRLFFAVVAVALCSILGFIFWDPILRLLTAPLPNLVGRILPGQHGNTPSLIETHIGGPFLVSLKIALATGIVVSSPFLLYQVWSFIAPALTRKERKYALPFTALGVVLFAVGLVLGYVVLRYPVNWLVSFGSDQFVLLPSADDYLTFVAYFLLAFGIVFELPLVLTFLGILGVINSRVLRAKRMYILFGLWVASCFITPGADPYSPVIIGVSLTVLFELSVILLRVLKK